MHDPAEGDGASFKVGKGISLLPSHGALNVVTIDWQALIQRESRFQESSRFMLEFELLDGRQISCRDPEFGNCPSDIR